MQQQGVPHHGRTSTRGGVEPRTPEDQARQGTTWHGRHRSNAGLRATLLSDPYVDADGQRHVEVKHAKQTRRPLLASFLADFSIDPPAPAAPAVPPPEPSSPQRVLPGTVAPPPFVPSGSLTAHGLAQRVAIELDAAGDLPGAAWVRSIAGCYAQIEPLAKAIAQSLPSARARLSKDTCDALWPADEHVRSFVEEVLAAMPAGTAATYAPALHAARTPEDVAKALPAACAEALPRHLWLQLAPYAHLLHDGLPARTPTQPCATPLEAEPAPVEAEPTPTNCAPMYAVGVVEGSEDHALLLKIVEHRNRELVDEGLTVTADRFLSKLVRDEARRRQILGTGPCESR